MITGGAVTTGGVSGGVGSGVGVLGGSITGRRMGGGRGEGGNTEYHTFITVQTQKYFVVKVKSHDLNFKDQKSYKSVPGGVGMSSQSLSSSLSKAR